MNTGIFTGHIGRTAELRHTTRGDLVANFSLGVNVGTKAKPETLWVDCQMWGDRGERLAPYLVKGLAVTAMGRVTLNKFQKQDGNFDAKIQLAVNEIEMHGKRDAQHEQHETPKPAAAAPRQNDFEDDIPF